MSESSWHGPSARVSALAYALGRQATLIANTPAGEDRKVVRRIRRMREQLEDLIAQAHADRQDHLRAEGA